MFERFNFNAFQFSFEKEETEAVFSHAALLIKTDRRHRMTKCKAYFYFKENKKNYRNKVFDQSEHTTENPY